MSIRPGSEIIVTMKCTKITVSTKHMLYVSVFISTELQRICTWCLKIKGQSDRIYHSIPSTLNFTVQQRHHIQIYQYKSLNHQVPSFRRHGLNVPVSNRATTRLARTRARTGHQLERTQPVALERLSIPRT
jgi:hypothetical protein